MKRLAGHNEHEKNGYDNQNPSTYEKNDNNSVFSHS